MIRDPSDGSVREVKHRQEPLKTNDKASESDDMSTALSGLAPEKYHREKSK